MTSVTEAPAIVAWAVDCDECGREGGWPREPDALTAAGEHDDEAHGGIPTAVVSAVTVWPGDQP